MSHLIRTSPSALITVADHPRTTHLILLRVLMPRQHLPLHLTAFQRLFHRLFAMNYIPNQHRWPKLLVPILKKTILPTVIGYITTEHSKMDN